MEPWKYDAIKIHNIASINPDQDLVLSEKIKHFLKIDPTDFERESVFILIGPKGFGKTLLLRYKRHLYQKNHKNLSNKYDVLLIPKDEDVAHGTASFDLKPELFKFYPDENFWKHIWMMAIHLTILNFISESFQDKSKSGNIIHSWNRLLVKLPNEIEESIIESPNLFSPYDFINKILNLPYPEFRKLRSCENDIYIFNKNIRYGVAIFIDGVDHFFDPMMDTKKERSFGYLDSDVWMNSQIGLIEAVWEITEKLKHIKIFATIRKEAFENFSKTSRKFSNIKGSVAEIDYAEDDLRKMMEINIKNMIEYNFESQLSHPDSISLNPFYAFLGLKENTILSKRGEREYPENIFGYIYRHSLKRPRDIIQFGDSLRWLRLTSRSSSNIKDVIHDECKKIYYSYMAESWPFLKVKDENIKKLFLNFHSNVIPYNEIKALCKCSFGQKECINKFECDKCNEIIPFRELFKIGLLGVAEEPLDPLMECKQQFLAPGNSNSKNFPNLPSSNLYYLHPLLNHVIKEIQEQESIKQYHLDKVLIGDKNPCVEFFINNRYCEFCNDICQKEASLDKKGIFLVYTLKSDQIMEILHDDLKQEFNDAKITKWTQNDEEPGHIFCDEVCPKILHNLRIISEISDYNPNVFFEIGFALGMGRKALFIQKKSLKVNEKIDVTFIGYESGTDLSQQVIKKIRSHWGSEVITSLFLTPSVFRTIQDFDNPEKRKTESPNTNQIFLLSNNPEIPNIKNLANDSRIQLIDKSEYNFQILPQPLIKKIINAKGILVHLAGRQNSINDNQITDARFLLLAGICVAQSIPVMIIQTNLNFYIDVQQISKFINDKNLFQIFEYIGAL